MEKYEYLSSEDSGNKPEKVEEVKFEYSLLGQRLNNKSKRKTEKTYKTVKSFKPRRVNLIYDSIRSFSKFRDFKDMIFDSMHKSCWTVVKNLLGLKTLIHKHRKEKM